MQGGSGLPLDSPDRSGYNIARMRHEIVFSPEAIEDLRSLKARWRAAVRDAIEQHLRYAPTEESGSHIKHLRGLSRPQYRLRVDEIRVFYDVLEGVVEILGIVEKPEAAAWLEKMGEQNEANRAG